MKKITSFFVCFTILLSILTAFCPNNHTHTHNVYGENELQLNSKAYVLMDFETNNLLSTYNENEKSEIASMVKLMTTYLLLEKIENKEILLTQKARVSNYAASMEGSQAFLNENEEYLVEDLLKSIIVASANDSSVVVAELIANTEENFVKMMNEKAINLGMTNTKYSNSTGLSNGKEQYSTAKDTAILLKNILKFDNYFEYSKIWMDELIHKDGRVTELVNTNRLIRNYSGCDIGKTGFTDDAGYCLSASAKKNNMRLISVIIGANNSKERFDTTTKLLDYGFNNFESKQIVNAEDELASIRVKKSNIDNLKVKFAENYFIVDKIGEKSDYEIKYKLPDKISAPININQKIATAYITKDGVVIKEIDIVASQEINKSTLKTALSQIIQNW